MGNSIILTKHHPSDLSAIERAEAFQISLLGGPEGLRRVKEQHGWWNERDQRAEFLSTTLEPEAPLPFGEAKKVYFTQIALRAAEGFVHSRSFNFAENKFLYRDLRQVSGVAAPENRL